MKDRRKQEPLWVSCYDMLLCDCMVSTLELLYFEYSDTDSVISMSFGTFTAICSDCSLNNLL